MKSPSLNAETGRVFGINWQPADEISVASGFWRDQSDQRCKNHVVLRLANSETETGTNMSMSRVRARQIARALWEASGLRWPSAPPRKLPNRILQEAKTVMTREADLGFAMANLLREAVRMIDHELEQRKHGGNDEDYADLEDWSDHAHMVLQQIGGAL